MVLRPPPHFGVVAIEKGAFGSPSTKVANLLIGPIGETLTDTTILGQSGLESNGNKGVFHTLELKPHHQMQFSVIPRTFFFFFFFLRGSYPYTGDTVNMF